MRFKHAIPVLLLGGSTVFGQVSPPAPAKPAPGVAISVITASSGAQVWSLGSGNSSMELGRVAYFGGVPSWGTQVWKSSASFVVSTRFGLRVDCTGVALFSRADVAMALFNPSPYQTVTIDGQRVSPYQQILVPGQTCGSNIEHQMDLEISTSAPAGFTSAEVNFSATLVN